MCCNQHQRTGLKGQWERRSFDNMKNQIKDVPRDSTDGGGGVAALSDQARSSSSTTPTAQYMEQSSGEAWPWENTKWSLAGSGGRSRS